MATVDDWKAIVERAVKDARDGDAKARDWLGRMVLADDLFWEMAGLPVQPEKSVEDLLRELAGSDK